MTDKDKPVVKKKNGTTPTKANGGIKRANSLSPEKRNKSPEKRSKSPEKKPTLTATRSVSPTKLTPTKSNTKKQTTPTKAPTPNSKRSLSPTKERRDLTKQMSGSLKPTQSDDNYVYIFSDIKNLVNCVQKELSVDKFGEKNKIVLVSVNNENISKMIEKAEIMIADPKIIAPYLKDCKSLKWLQSTWAGVDSIFRQFKTEREEIESKHREYKQRREEFEQQRLDLECQKNQIMAELGGVDEALAQARVQVEEMTKQNLEELRTLNNPPSLVKFCLEAVFMLLSPSDSHPMSWENIRKLTRKDDFIQSVLDFDGINQGFPANSISTIKSQYLSQSNFTRKNVEYASKACGPLMGWLDAQIQLGELMNVNAPLINKYKEIQKQYKKLLSTKKEIPEPPPLPSMPPSYKVSRLAGVFGQPMSEYVFANILSLERKLPQLRLSQANKVWQKESLSDLTIGIMGLGDIGSRIGEVAKMFGMQVWGLVQDPTRHQTKGGIDRLFTLSSINGFLSGVDYVINVLPNTETTNNLLSPANAECLFVNATKKPVFINVGRGNRYYYRRGYTSRLRERMVLDVFNEEPLPSSSGLWSHPCVSISPHVAAISKDVDVAKVFKTNLENFLENKPLKNVVDWEKEY